MMPGIMSTKKGNLSFAEYKRITRKRGKFGNIVVDTPDGRFDSKAEYERFCQLRLLAASGQIRDLRRQVPFELSVCKYIADFVYFDNVRGVEVVEDVKGVRTNIYKLKRKMMQNELGITILETGPKRMKRTRRKVRRV